MKKVSLILCIIMLGLMMSACKKDAVTSSYPYTVKMTDAPGPYTAVYIDLQGVEITGNEGKEVLINVHTGIYNLLDFSNGKDTIIATGILEDATVQQIRLILGPNNSVVSNGVSYPLSTPSAEQSGLKIQVHHTLQANVQYDVLIDFDADKSIVDEGNGNYKLKPVIRTIEAASNGIIKGKITPAGTLAFVTSTSSLSYSSYISTSGDFQIRGLPPGTYSVTVTPLSPLTPVTHTDIAVTTGATTDIGTIIL
jgi:hypothetical protein